MTTIKVLFVNDPKNNPAYGSVKLDDGAYMSVPKNMLGQFQPNTSYDVTFVENVGKDGKTYRTIKTVKAPSNGVSNVVPINGGGGKYGATDNVTAKRIYICGILNGLAHAGMLSAPHDAEKWWRGLEQVWDNVHKPKITSAISKQADDLNDEIPW